MQTVTVDIAADGGVKIETKGFTGKSCQEATAALEKALGVVSSDSKLPEFYQQETKRATH